MARLARLLAIACWSLSSTTAGYAQTSDSLAQRLAAVPAELYLADSSLRIVNLYKPEAIALLDTSRSTRFQVLDGLKPAASGRVPNGGPGRCSRPA